MDAAGDVVEKATALAEDRGIPNLTFEVGDAYALRFDADAFDVVHAHQLLQHLTRPVEALREFRRVVRPDGIVSVREVDYGGTIWFPQLPALDEWIAVYDAVHRGTSGEPNAGRRLKSWAREAGFDDIASAADVWVFETPEDRRWWGSSWAERAVASSFAEHALALGATDRAGLERIADGWREWAEHPDGWLLMPHASIVARG